MSDVQAQEFVVRDMIKSQKALEAREAERYFDIKEQLNDLKEQMLELKEQNKILSQQMLDLKEQNRILNLGMRDIHEIVRTLKPLMPSVKEDPEADAVM